jgi:hypothetical protein
MDVRSSLACALLALAVAGCGGGGDSTKVSGPAPNWPAPSNPMELTRKAGLTPERAEFLEYHVHAHLDVFFNGEPVTVPAGIGIDTTNPAVVSDEQGAGLKRDCDKPCISPLHTHAPDGVLHTETKTPKPNTLGQFFVEWDVPLEADRVGKYTGADGPLAIYVDGEVFTGDPGEIELSDGREIAIVIGTAPDPIPSEFAG